MDRCGNVLKMGGKKWKSGNVVNMEGGEWRDMEMWLNGRRGMEGCGNMDGNRNRVMNGSTNVGGNGRRGLKRCGNVVEWM